MPEKTAIFRADASPSIGGGHVMRCLTLAGELRNRGWQCLFAVSSETPATVPALASSRFEICPAEYLCGCDFLVVDHYGLGAEYEAFARRAANTILVIDDLANRAHDCDILLDQTYGRDRAAYTALVPDACKLLCGAEYALLRPQFAALRSASLQRRDKSGGRIEKVLIACGTTNIGNVTGFILKSLAEISAPLSLDVVMGSAAIDLDKVQSQAGMINQAGLHNVAMHIDTPDMATFMAEADLAIGAGGTTSWERCCLGLPSIILEMAKNQSLIAAKLHEAGAIHYLGCYGGVSEADLRRSVGSFLAQPENLSGMSHAARAVCDGRGVFNLLKEIEKC